MMMTKYIIITAITTLLLLVLGLWSVPLLLGQITDSVIQSPVATLTSEENVNFYWSGGLVPAACAPAAMAMLWAYSRKRSGWPRVYGFFLWLVVAIASVAAGIVIRLLSIWNLERLTRSLGNVRVSVSLRYLGYYRWGFRALLIVCGVSTIILFLMSLQRTETVDIILI